MQQLLVTTFTEEDLTRLIKQAIIQVLDDRGPVTIVDPSKLLSRKEVAERLHITLSTLNSWTRTGKIQGKRIGRRVLYSIQDVDSALKSIRSNR